MAWSLFGGTVARLAMGAAAEATRNKNLGGLRLYLRSPTTKKHEVHFFLRPKQGRQGSSKFSHLARLRKESRRAGASPTRKKAHLNKGSGRFRTKYHGTPTYPTH